MAHNQGTIVALGMQGSGLEDVVIEAGRHLPGIQSISCGLASPDRFRFASVG